MCTRIWWVRPVSSETRSSASGACGSSSSKWVRPHAGCRCRSSGGRDRGGPGRSAHRSCPSARAGPSTSVRYSRRSSRACSSALSCAVHAVALGHHQQPESHDRGGGRSRPDMDLLRPPRGRQRLRERALRGPWPGARRRPAGLSTTIRASSSKSDRERAGAGPLTGAGRASPPDDDPLTGGT